MIIQCSEGSMNYEFTSLTVVGLIIVTVFDFCDQLKQVQTTMFMYSVLSRPATFVRKLNESTGQSQGAAW